MQKRFLVIHAAEDMRAAHTMISPLDPSMLVMAEYRPSIMSVTLAKDIGALVLWSRHLEPHADGVRDVLKRQSGRFLLCAMDDTPVPESLSKLPVHHVGPMEHGVDADGLINAIKTEAN